MLFPESEFEKYKVDGVHEKFGLFPEILFWYVAKHGAGEPTESDGDIPERFSKSEIAALVVMLGGQGAAFVMMRESSIKTLLLKMNERGRAFAMTSMYLHRMDCMRQVIGTLMSDVVLNVLYGGMNAGEFHALAMRCEIIFEECSKSPAGAALRKVFSGEVDSLYIKKEELENPLCPLFEEVCSTCDDIDRNWLLSDYSNGGAEAPVHRSPPVLKVRKTQLSDPHTF